MRASTTIQLSDPMPFAGAMWSAVPNEPGVYVIADEKEVVYVGMAGRNGKGGIRNRLRDHASGQIVNMFAQYLFLEFSSLGWSELRIHEMRRPRAVNT